MKRQLSTGIFRVTLALLVFLSGLAPAADEGPSNAGIVHPLLPSLEATYKKHSEARTTNTLKAAKGVRWLYTYKMIRGAKETTSADDLAKLAREALSDPTDRRALEDAFGRIWRGEAVDDIRVVGGNLWFKNYCLELYFHEDATGLERQKPFGDADLAAARKELATIFENTLNAARLERFNSIGDKSTVFGVLLDSKAIKNLDREKRVIAAVQKLLSGDTPTGLKWETSGLTYKEDGDAEAQKVKIIFYEKQKPEAKHLNDDEQRVMQARLIRHAKEVLVRRTSRETPAVPQRLEDFRGPRVIESDVTPSNTPTNVLSGEDFVAKLTDWKDIMAFLEESHPKFAERVTAEIKKVKVSREPFESFSTHELRASDAATLLITEMVRNRKGVIELAGPSFAQLKSPEREYAFFYGLMAGLPNATEASAFNFTLKVKRKAHIDKEKKVSSALMEEWLAGLVQSPRTRELLRAEQKFKTTNLGTDVDDLDATLRDEIKEELSDVLAAVASARTASVRRDVSELLGTTIPDRPDAAVERYRAMRTLRGIATQLNGGRTPDEASLRLLRQAADLIAKGKLKEEDLKKLLEAKEAPKDSKEPAKER